MAFKVVTGAYHSQGDDPVLMGIAEGFAERFPLLDHLGNVVTRLRSGITDQMIVEDRTDGLWDRDSEMLDES